MSSRLSHGLQTCLEPRVTEARVLRLVLAPSKNSDVAVESLNTGWNFIEALSNTSLMLKEHKDHEHVYIHPSVKRPECRLSEKSLEMCTESLGSETGSKISEGDENDETALSSEKNMLKNKVKNINGSGLKSRETRLNLSRNFPPPLTSMTGATGFVRVKTYREEGKLVLKAVKMCSSNPIFEAERANGRLTLRVARSELGEERM